MIRGLRGSDHLLKCLTLLGVAAGYTNLKEDFQQDNVIVLCVVTDQLLLGVWGKFFLFVSADPDKTKTITLFKCFHMYHLFKSM